MNQTFLARSKFKECAEILDGNDLSGEDHILFKFRYDKPDRFLGGLHLLIVRTGDRNKSIILDINGYTILSDRLAKAEE